MGLVVDLARLLAALAIVAWWAVRTLLIRPGLGDYQWATEE